MAHHSNMPLNVLIVEDHELVRYGLVMALEDHGAVHVVGEAENGQEALDRISALKPDIVLMDIGMPVKDGITATQELKRQWPDIKVVMLTSHKDPQEVLASLTAGADAYCMKDIKVDRLCQVLETVYEGAVWLDPSVASIVLHALSHDVDSEGATVEKTDDLQPTVKRKRYNMDLTEREEEVLRLIVDGKSNKEIAQLLNITTHTAKAHVGNIIQKLAVDDRTQAAVKALREGYVHTIPSH